MYYTQSLVKNVEVAYIYVCVWLYLSSFGISYGYELLSNDRQNFDVDSVKFIKTTPSTRLSKPTKEASHHLEESSVTN